MRTKISILFMAFVLCIGAFAMSLTAYAASGTDTTPPTLTIMLDGGQLTVSASDDNSGVEAVYIDGNRVNSLTNGKATIALKDYAGTGKKISIYAVDYAGNRSETKKLDNPYYKEPAQQTQAPSRQNTSSTNNTSQSGNGGQTANAGSTQNQDPNNATDTGQTPTADNAAVSDPSSTETVSAIPDGAFTPEGTGTVLDSATDADGDKRFYTITTAAGNVFYLIIDGKRDNNNVYFLNSVTEADLLALAEKDDNVTVSGVPIIETCTCMDKCEAGHVNTDCPVCKNDLTKCTGKEAPASPTEPPMATEPIQKSGGNTGTIIFIIVAVIAAAGVGYYVKIVRPKRQSGFDDDADGFEDENPASGDYYAEPEYLTDEDEYNGDGE